MIELIDFGDLYNKTSIERGGMLYNSSPRKIQWVAINQNDLEGTKSFISVFTLAWEILEI